ncbi:LysR family transcriptional regulator [Maritimibacter alexandrii]|uniref:LysR family transcriptional regulator n=1 Tax=Maritimibacter alexandrii TaxID=2570355 RepID=UPI00110872C8|nr:LysR family transcriptional regulator [Maritimibacter alexandrii]
MNNEENGPLDNTAKLRQVGGTGGGLTFRRLQIFWAVANASSLTRASKQIGLAQPTVSQQIASLEDIVGMPLFERRSNSLELTEAGRQLMRHVQKVLESMQSLEDGLGAIGDGSRRTLRLAGLNSILRVLVPTAMEALHKKFSEIDYDIHESAPAEVIEMLYARRINLGLISSNSIAPASAGFEQIHICTDPYVLAVPSDLDLSGVTDPSRDLSAKDQDVLFRSIQFAFGTQHSRRVQAWYDGLMPGNRPFAQARSFEVAIGMVRAGLGICLAPAMSCVVGDRVIDGVRLYRVDFPARDVVALLPKQYLRQELYSCLIDELGAAGRTYAPPPASETPPFLLKPTPEFGPAS